jgi:hypothetical protein
MTSSTVRIAVALGLAGSLAACAGTQGPGFAKKQDNFGEASRQTFAAQVINPSPVYDEPFALGSGAKAAAELERYRTDKVKQPQPQRVSTFGSTGRGN